MVILHAIMSFIQLGECRCSGGMGISYSVITMDVRNGGFGMGFEVILTDVSG